MARSSRRPTRRSPKTRTPYVAYGLGALAVLLAVRGLYRPARALTSSGVATRCPGQECSGDVLLEVPAVAPVYAVGTGKVVDQVAGAVSIALDTEPFILTYVGLTPTVARGDAVGIGQTLGTVLTPPAGKPTLAFSVQELLPKDSTGAGPFVRQVDPIAWLLARGRSLTVSGTAGALCGVKGREYQAPAAAPGCVPLSLPKASPYLILPVSIAQGTFQRAVEA